MPGLLAEVAGRPASQLRGVPFGQLFGGRSVPMARISSVISALFPTVPPLYRRRGWERAGVLEVVDPWAPWQSGR